MPGLLPGHPDPGPSRPGTSDPPGRPGCRPACGPEHRHLPWTRQPGRFSVTPVTFLNRCNHPCYRVSPAHRSWPTQRPVTSCACTNAETGFRHPPGRPGSGHSVLCFVYISMAFTVCPWSDTLLSSWKQRIPGRGKAKVYIASPDPAYWTTGTIDHAVAGWNSPAMPYHRLIATGLDACTTSRMTAAGIRTASGSTHHTVNCSSKA